MRIYKLADGTQISGAFVGADGTKYPGNWLDLATAADLARAGVTMAVVADPAPPPQTVIDGTVFMTRVTDQEMAAVEAAAQQNIQLARWMEELRLKNAVDVTSADAQAAKAALVAAGLLTQSRADLIFATA